MQTKILLSALLALTCFSTGAAQVAFGNPNAHVAPQSARMNVPLQQTSSSGSSSNGLVNFNLKSTVANLAVPAAMKSPLNILVGGAQQRITPQTMLTPAQTVAVYQVLSSGIQSLALGNRGNAVGGSFTIGSHFSNYASGLFVPRGVTAIDKAALLQVTGNLVSAGKIFVVPSSATASRFLDFNMQKRIGETDGAGKWGYAWGYASHLMEFLWVSIAWLASLSASLFCSRRTWEMENFGISAIHRLAAS